MLRVHGLHTRAAIQLNHRAQQAWIAAGKPHYVRPGPIVDDSTRFVGIELLFKTRSTTTEIILWEMFTPQKL